MSSERRFYIPKYILTKIVQTPVLSDAKISGIDPSPYTGDMVSIESINTLESSIPYTTRWTVDQTYTAPIESTYSKEVSNSPDASTFNTILTSLPVLIWRLLPSSLLGH